MSALDGGGVAIGHPTPDVTVRQLLLHRNNSAQFAGGAIGVVKSSRGLLRLSSS